MIRTGISVENTKGERAVEKFTRNIGILAAAAAFVGITAPSQADDLLYDWRAVDAASTPVSGFIPAPFVSTGNTAAAQSVLTQTQASNPGKVAVKVVGSTPLTAADVA